MRALVTGAAGFIGSHLVCSLASDGYEVVAVDSAARANWERLPGSVRRVQADIVELSTQAGVDLMTGVDVVFHLAAKKYNTPGVTADQLIATNVSASWKLFEAAATAQVDRVVFTSSLYAYGGLGPEAMSEAGLPEPRTLYGASKLMGENIGRTLQATQGLNWAAARLFFIYGPWQFIDGGYKSVVFTNFERLTRGLPPIVRGDGLQALDYVYITDCVAGLRAMGDDRTPGLVVNISTGTATTVNHLVAAMSSVARDDQEPIFEPPDWTQGTSRYGDPTLASERLGWRSTVALEEGLSLTWESILKETSGR